ncbi:uncharacterized protein LAESUDRAFT_665566 [Laetiporus sulphureus 93-53]|uniref:CFEM domain-containing protein n=1 Tax=Laetiporus sulphureus 93-53 TaxID=1314785 RepID=A0A165BCB4_9APHY|nr:uncharacterized protein LAESUDRAFT_665566 [Laetiporus sulphureus 93-53]KZT00727.1 hypothetical protein LAESUDRAFT_665566 [Laetiporus sulphureus 93-53]
MRFTAILVALSGAFVAANAVILKRQSLPTCADTCLTNANLDGCNASDDSCLCNDKTFVDSVTSCIESACTGSDLTEAEEYAQQLCLAVGVTLTASSAASTSGSATASGSSTSSATATSTSTAAS